MDSKLLRYVLVYFAFCFVFLGFNVELCAEYLDKDLISSVSEKVPERPPSKVVYEQCIDSGLYYFNNGLYKEAKNSFWKAVELFPDNPDAYINLAIVHIKEANYDNAKRILIQARELSTEDYYQREILLYNLGLCYYMSRDYKSAARYFLEALSEYPDFAEARYYLGMSYDRLGNKNAAFLNIFAAQYLFGKRKTDEYREYRNEIEGFLKTLRKGKRLDKVSLSEDFLEEGKKSLENKDLDKASVFLQESVFLNPEYIDAYYELALLHSRKKAFYNAIVYLNRILEVDEKSTKALLSLGYVYRELKKYEKALGVFEKALELKKDNPMVYYDIGMTYLEDGKLHIAKKYLGQGRKVALKQKNLSYIEKINAAYERIEIAQRRKKSPASVSKEIKTRKQARSLYPHYVISGNKGYLDRGYFMAVPKREIKGTESKSKTTVTEY